MGILAYKEGDPMRLDQFVIILTVSCLAYLTTGCREEKIWEAFCIAAKKCAHETDQMFSKTECEREYKESVERHKSVHCGVPYEDYLDCQMSLSCASWTDVSDDCANDIDRLNRCLE